MRALTLTLLLCTLFCFAHREPETQFEWPATLSEWRLFESPLSNLIPAESILPYDVHAPLYSDYASKSRFIKLPEGLAAQYQASGPFEMPDGTILIKHFYYPHDERNPALGRRNLETRLIVKDQGIWHAMTYKWNQEQTEARRAVAGGALDVSWINKDGKSMHLNYLIPDVNQCKNCHNRDGVLQPLGIKAGQLNRNDSQGVNQMISWQKGGILDGLPERTDDIPVMHDYDDSRRSLDTRARAYLDANCGHCHSPWGSARTSGLHLNSEETNRHALGVMKPPVAAGRGTGGMEFNIVPGKPKKSILLYRMESGDPGIRMPEINRQLAHTEGIDLIREWIASLE